MTPKEKANELFNYYWSLLPMTIDNDIELSKQFSLRAVDEIIKELKMRNGTIKFWQEVKEEINKL